MMSVGDIMNTAGVLQYTVGHHEYSRGYPVHWGDTMSTLGGYHEYSGGCSVH